MLSGKYTSYITPADRKVPPWRREGPSKRQRDPSRAPLGGLRCTRSLPPPATFAAPIASSIGLTPATAAAIPGSGPRPAAAAAAAATLVTPTPTESA